MPSSEPNESEHWFFATFFIRAEWNFRFSMVHHQSYGKIYKKNPIGGPYEPNHQPQFLHHRFPLHRPVLPCDLIIPSGQPNRKPASSSSLDHRFCPELHHLPPWNRGVVRSEEWLDLCEEHHDHPAICMPGLHQRLDLGHRVSTRMNGKRSLSIEAIHRHPVPSLHIRYTDHAERRRQGRYRVFLHVSIG